MKLLCSTAFKGIMPFLLEQYNPNAINSFEITYGTTLGLVEQCMTRLDIDAVIFTDNGIEHLLKHQKLLKSSVTPITKTGLGIAIAKDSKPVDISSTKSFIDTLLECDSIAFTQHGASGMYFSRLIQRLNIEHEILQKAIRPEGGLVAKLVESNEVQLAVQLVSEIKAVDGVNLLGLIPEEYQEWSVFSIAKTIDSTSDGINHFIEFLKTPKLQKELAPFGFFNL